MIDILKDRRLLHYNNLFLSRRQTIDEKIILLITKYISKFTKCKISRIDYCYDKYKNMVINIEILFNDKFIETQIIDKPMSLYFGLLKIYPCFKFPYKEEIRINNLFTILFELNSHIKIYGIYRYCHPNMAGFLKRLLTTNKDFSYGVIHVTRGEYYSVVSIDDSECKIQRVYNLPSIDCNGDISFSEAISTVTRSYFDNEFEVVTREQFFHKFPELKQFIK